MNLVVYSSSICSEVVLFASSECPASWITLSPIVSSIIAWQHLYQGCWASVHQSTVGNVHLLQRYDVMQMFEYVHPPFTGNYIPISCNVHFTKRTVLCKLAATWMDTAVSSLQWQYFESCVHSQYPLNCTTNYLTITHYKLAVPRYEV